MRKALLMAALAVAVVGGALGCGGKGGTDKAAPAADTSAVAADTVLAAVVVGGALGCEGKGGTDKAAPAADTAAVAADTDTDTDTTFTDKRDGKVYRIVKIGSQTWFAENLNYDAKGSVCYDNKDANCAKYGRLYNWETALKACPAGYHLPSDDEWTALVNYAGGEENAGKKLKSKAGWNKNGNGTDDYGWSALPGGIGGSGGSFYYAGYVGIWWSSTEFDAWSAWGRDIDYTYEFVSRDNDYKSLLFSVRCAQD